MYKSFTDITPTLRIFKLNNFDFNFYKVPFKHLYWNAYGILLSYYTYTYIYIVRYIQFLVLPLNEQDSFKQNWNTVYAGLNVFIQIKLICDLIPEKLFLLYKVTRQPFIKNKIKVLTAVDDHLGNINDYLVTLHIVVH
jgi:hypothetical protein